MVAANKGYHVHQLHSGETVCHAHDSEDDTNLKEHSHDNYDAPEVAAGAGAPPQEQSPGKVHEHVLKKEGGSGVIRIRHRHPVPPEGHAHQGEALGEVELLPLRARGWRVLFPAWTAPHPWWHVWPVCHSRPSHAKFHFNSSGIDDFWPGALTAFTQLFKVAVAVFAWCFGRDDPDAFYNPALWATLAVCVVLGGAWMWIWPNYLNILLSIVNYGLYEHGWTLSLMTLYRRVQPVYHIPQPCALVFVLVPPAYIAFRTLLFLPSPVRRKRFLLAALNNRAMPLELNMYVVGPKQTVQSHEFLTAMNSYTMLSTLASKVVIFSLERPALGDIIAHVAHVVTTVWATLYAIRCRQIALDTFPRAGPAAPDAAGGATPTELGHRA